MKFNLNEWYDDDDINYEDYFDSHDAAEVWSLVKDKMTSNQINQMWVDKAWPALDNKTKQEILKDFEVNSIDEVSFDDMDDYVNFDDLQDMGFLDDAYEEEKEKYMQSEEFLDGVADSIAYNRDPLGYYGMSERDFY